MSVSGATLNLCELSGITCSLSGRGWSQFGAVNHDVAVEDTEEHDESGDFSAMLQTRPLEFVNQFLYTRGVVVLLVTTNRAARLRTASILLMFCLVCGSHSLCRHIPQKVGRRSCWTKNLVGIGADVMNVLIPVQIMLYGDAEVLYRYHSAQNKSMQTVGGFSVFLSTAYQEGGTLP